MKITQIKQMKKNQPVKLRDGRTAFCRGMSTASAGTHAPRVVLAESTGTKKTFEVAPQAITGEA